MNPLFASILARNPAVPAPLQSSINDDDLYVFDLVKRRIVAVHGSGSAAASAARTHGLLLRPGQALMRGMQLRHSILLDTPNTQGAASCRNA